MNDDDDADHGVRTDERAVMLQNIGRSDGEGWLSSEVGRPLSSRTSTGYELERSTGSMNILFIQSTIHACLTGIRYRLGQISHRFVMYR